MDSTQDPLTCESSSEPMTYLQLAEEVVRLRAWLAFLSEDAGDTLDLDPGHVRRKYFNHTTREFVEQALAGEAAPQ